jgi:hypothetical protein
MPENGHYRTQEAFSPLYGTATTTHKPLFNQSVSLVEVIDTRPFEH